jgi:hypothetical protein
MLDVRTFDDDTIAAIANDPDTVRRILGAVGLLTMEGVGARVGISYYRIKILRGKRVKLEADGVGPMPRSDALPPALPIPGDPVWHPAEIEIWGRQTGRLDQEGRPQRARPTGRPRRPRPRQEQTAA